MSKAYDKQISQQKKEANAIKKENARIAKIESYHKKAELENARANEAKAIANRRKSQHEQRIAHPLVRAFAGKTKPKTQRKHRRTKAFGRGSGWGL